MKIYLKEWYIVCPFHSMSTSVMYSSGLTNVQEKSLYRLKSRCRVWQPYVRMVVLLPVNNLQLPCSGVPQRENSGKCRGVVVSMSTCDHMQGVVHLLFLSLKWQWYQQSEHLDVHQNMKSSAYEGGGGGSCVRLVQPNVGRVLLWALISLVPDTVTVWGLGVTSSNCVTSPSNTPDCVAIMVWLLGCRQLVHSVWRKSVGINGSARVRKNCFDLWSPISSSRHIMANTFYWQSYAANIACLLAHVKCAAFILEAVIYRLTRLPTTSHAQCLMTIGVQGLVPLIRCYFDMCTLVWFICSSIQSHM
jgi:hypothetical protein